MSIWEKRGILLSIKKTSCSEELSREFEIIGEATSQILKLEPEFPLQHARRIVDTRNWVIHGYDRVDDVIIWGILSNHLPSLRTEVNALLTE